MTSFRIALAALIAIFTAVACSREEIVAEAGKRQVDLVMMATHGRTALSRAADLRAEIAGAHRVTGRRVRPPN
jgi:hypothetical protein